MNPIFKNFSAGQKIIKACGGLDDDKGLYPVDEETIVQGINETIELLRNSQFYSKKKLKDSFLVQTLFIHPKKITEKTKQNYSRASTQIIIEFLEWLLNIPALQGRLHEIQELLQTFVFDLGCQGVLGDKFFSVNCGRSKTNHTFFHFYESKNALFLRNIPPYQIQEFFSVFGLRQAMEIKFRRVLGFVDTRPSIKLRHDVFPSIISSYKKEIFFLESKDVTLEDILHIYKWTNESIHYMISRYPWLIWKAFDICSCVFDPNSKGPSLAIGLDSAFQFHVNTLRKMRIKLIEKIQIISNKQKQIYDIFWNNPEAFIYNENKKTLNLDEENLNKTTRIIPNL